ncbi:MAG: hypothetical protein ACHP84_20510 [Caulobacterales bacterium]|jgi:hypothetical protein
MRFWSEGLGDQELVMGLDRARLERKADFMSLTGVVDSPAPWEYEVRMQFDDWSAILKTATSKAACDFLATNVSVRDLVRIVLSIGKFVVLLGWFRATRLMGLAQKSHTIEQSVGDAASN